MRALRVSVRTRHSRELTHFQTRQFVSPRVDKEKRKAVTPSEQLEDETSDNQAKEKGTLTTAWDRFLQSLGRAKDSFSHMKPHAPEWANSLSAKIQTLQRELSMAEGSLAGEIWAEAQDATKNPEIAKRTHVRISRDLCDEEHEFRRKRLAVITKALAKYLDIPEKDIHPHDVPLIATCNSGGSVRAIIANGSSLQAAKDAGLWDCVLYTAGVSSSCWLQSFYFSTVGEQDYGKIIERLKERVLRRLSDLIHLFTTSPADKYLLKMLIEKVKGDPDSDLGIIDLYSLILAARFIDPKRLDDSDLKLSKQADYLVNGQHPLPIYSFVRHEIINNKVPGQKEYESWYQWIESTPYEVFFEELCAGIPTWALGRRFNNGKDETKPGRPIVPEIRIPMLWGIWGSAFCASIARYYNQVRPYFRKMAGFHHFDRFMQSRIMMLDQIQPIDSGAIPNYVFGLEDRLPKTRPASVSSDPYLQLVDAGMSSNLPFYPLFRRGRNADVIIAFDSSADINAGKQLCRIEGYKVQKGLRGRSIHPGWPGPETTPTEVAETMRQTFLTPYEPPTRQEIEASRAETNADQQPDPCTVYLTTAYERVAVSEPPPFKRDFHAGAAGFFPIEPGTGQAVLYFPLVANPDTPKLQPSDEERKRGEMPRAIDPENEDFMSTWNFSYTPQQVDAVAGLARTNFEQRKEQVKRVIRGIYEKKKRDRLAREQGFGRQ